MAAAVLVPSVCLILMMALPVFSQDSCPRKCECIAFDTDCSKQGLTRLPDEGLRSYTEYLRLEHNKIRHVTRLGLAELREYYLQYNKITRIDSNAFMDTVELRILDLSHNQLESSSLEPIHFQQLANLESLDLSYNKLKSVGSGIFHGDFLTNLRTLDLSFNQLEVISPNAFINLRRLVILRLNNNRLQSIQSNSFIRLDGLSYLHLENNDLTSIGGQSSLPFPELTNLTLNNNKLASIRQGMLSKLTRFESLDLSNNEFKEIPRKALSDVITLKTLKISRVPVQKLVKEDFPKSLKTLTTLSIRKMANLTEFDADAFENLPSLKNVVISDNPRLLTMPNILFHESYRKLRKVDLSNNSLTSLPADILPWDKLFTMNVSGNRWVCDCHSQWMKNYSFENEITCNEPSDLKQQTLNLIKRERLMICFEKKTDNHFKSYATRLALAAVGLILAIGLIGLLLFKYRHRLPFTSRAPYISLYNIYDPRKDLENDGIVVTFRGDKVETKAATVEMEKQMI